MTIWRSTTLEDRHTRHASEERKGVGLFTAEQEKNTTPLQYLAQIVIGASFALVGGLLVYQLVTLRGDEIREFGSADWHVWDWITSLAVVIAGVFVAHAGVIFYARRMKNRVFGPTRRSTPGAQ